MKTAAGYLARHRPAEGGQRVDSHAVRGLAGSVRPAHADCSLQPLQPARALLHQPKRQHEHRQK